MPDGKWFATTINYTITATGIQIVIQTDVACHLWMRETTTVPQEHPIQREKRGLLFMMDKYYCFDVYEDNEQEEAGDTLIHTFIKEPWPICETRYFYFHGEINGSSSPSTTAIFKKHRTAPPFGPLTWIECPLTQAPAAHGARDPSWPIVRTELPTWSSWAVGEDSRTLWLAPNYYNYRNGIVWDTSGIPAGSQIVQAFMRRYGYYVQRPLRVDFDFTWVDANAWNGLLNAADYPIWNDWTTVVASLLVLTTWSSRDWHDIPLTPAGLSAIVPAGLTKMVSKTDADNDNVDPVGEDREFYWYGIADPTYPQKLHVQYRPPL